MGRRRGTRGRGNVDERAEENCLKTREAAAWLGLSPKTLERYRVSGEGRDFRKSGTRVCYLLEDLEKWVSARGGREIPSRRAAFPLRAMMRRMLLSVRRPSRSQPDL